MRVVRMVLLILAAVEVTFVVLVTRTSHLAWLSQCPRYTAGCKPHLEFERPFDLRELGL